MSERHAKKSNAEVERELTRKEQLLRHRDRERHKKLYTFVGVALGLSLALVLIGVVYQFLVVPNSAAAKVGDVSISAAAFQKRVQYDKISMQNQLTRLQQFEQQLGGQGYFQAQISQLQATLASPFSLGSQTLDNMIEDVLVAKEAEARGITVSDDEVEAALREEIANSSGLVTEAQATATAEAGIAATATAAQWTPTPTATVNPNASVTETAQVPTPQVPPPAAIITETTLTEGLSQLEQSLKATGMTLTDYRQIVRSRLLRDKLTEAIGAEKVTPTEEQAHARHILLSVAEPTPTPSAPITGTDTLTSEVDSNAALTATENVSATAAVSPTAAVTSTEAVTAATPVTAAVAATTTASVTSTSAVTTSAAVTATQAATATGNVTTTAAVSESASLTSTESITSTAEISGTHGPYSDAEALALANQLRERILAGEDFAALAQAYSDDRGSAVEGGDLGWFAKGTMVPEFDQAAFSLPIGEVSEPIKTTYGYHLIEVLERDQARPKAEAQLKQENAQAFQAWLDEQLGSDQIQRTGDLTTLLPKGL